jgi:glutamate synthase (NADPH/NADH) large chain
VSLSSRTLGYKGMVTTLQLEPFYPDLRRALRERARRRALALLDEHVPVVAARAAAAHARAQRRDQHGRREPQLDARAPVAARVGAVGDIRPLLPICTEGASDSASFDEVLELLTLTGRSLPHAIMMMVPEAYEKQADIAPDLRAFYEYHSMQMEPWDGPAALIFTDGTLVGATLDRNGLRPGRWTETTDGLVVIGSETGVLDFAPERIKRRGRLRPGRMFLVDTAQRRIIEDDEVKRDLAPSSRGRNGWTPVACA